MALRIAGEKLEDILDKYNVRPNDKECVSCDVLYDWDEYKFDFGYLIISAKMHECGEKYRTKKLIPIAEKEKAYWKGIMG